MNPSRWLFLCLSLLTLLRLWIIGSVELSPDESYYYQWSQHPDLCYFSKGPGVAAAIWVSTHLFGAGEFGIRFFSPILSMGTSLLLFALARRLYSESAAAWTVIGMNFLPIFHVGSVVMTIDPLSIFFWSAVLYTFWRAIEQSTLREEEALGAGWSLWWPATGVLLGLGFLSKWTNAMQLLSIVLLLASSARLRRHFRQPGFWCMLLIFLIFTAPPIVWNAQHDWVTVNHVSQRGGLQKAFTISLGEPLAFFGAHMGVYSPLLFIALIIALFNGLQRVRDHIKPRFLVAFALPLLVMYGWLSLRKAGEANWTAPAMLSLGVLAAPLWHERARQSAGTRRFLGIGLGFGLLLSVLIVNLDLLRTCGFPLPYRKDPSARLRGWHSLAESVGALRDRIEAEIGKPVFIISNSYGNVSILGYYLPRKPSEGPGHPPVYIPESQDIENQYSLWPRYDEFLGLKPGQKPRDPLFTEESGINPFHGRTALYVTNDDSDTPPSSIQGGFEKTELIACYELVRRGQNMRQIRVFRCTNYHSRSL